MSNIIKFRPPAPKVAQCVRIVASRFQDRFRYHVLPDENSPIGSLHTSCLDDARASAEYFSKNIVEVGPPAAFGRGSE